MANWLRSKRLQKLCVVFENIYSLIASAGTLHCEKVLAARSRAYSLDTGSIEMCLCEVRRLNGPKFGSCEIRIRRLTRV